MVSLHLLSGYGISLAVTDRERFTNIYGMHDYISNSRKNTDMKKPFCIGYSIKPFFGSLQCYTFFPCLPANNYLNGVLLHLPWGNCQYQLHLIMKIVHKLSLKIYLCFITMYYGVYLEKTIKTLINHIYILLISNSLVFKYTLPFIFYF